MAGNMTLDQLKEAVEAGRIDTVLVAGIDMQGRLMGKRFEAHFFVRRRLQGNPLLQLSAGRGHGDEYRSGLQILELGDRLWRLCHEARHGHAAAVPWLPGTALVLADMLDHHTHDEVPHSPRAILKRQVARARALGFEPMMATELEFYLFENSYESLRDNGFRDLQGHLCLQRGLPHLPDHQGRGRDARHPQRALWRGHPDRKFQGRGGCRARGGELQILRRAGHRRQPHHRQAWHQGDRLDQGPVGHLHGQV